MQYSTLIKSSWICKTLPYQNPSHCLFVVTQIKLFANQMSSTTYNSYCPFECLPKKNCHHSTAVLFSWNEKLQLLQRLSELIGAGSTLAVAVDTVQTANDLIHGHTLHQFGDALQISVTAAGDLQRLHDPVLHNNVHITGANSLGGKIHLHTINAPFSVSELSRLDTKYSITNPPA